MYQYMTPIQVTPYQARDIQDTSYAKQLGFQDANDMLMRTRSALASDAYNGDPQYIIMLLGRQAAALIELAAPRPNYVSDNPTTDGSR